MYWRAGKQETAGWAKIAKGGDGWVTRARRDCGGCAWRVGVFCSGNLFGLITLSPWPRSLIVLFIHGHLHTLDRIADEERQDHD